MCWGAFAATWLVGAIYNQSRAPAERTRTGLGSWGTGWIIVAVAWTAVPRADWASLTVPAPPWARLAILLAATVLTIWARLALGTMWSAAPAVKQGHQLRTSGPYGITRHPIYTGILGMMLGSLLLAAGGRWLVPFPFSSCLPRSRSPSENGSCWPSFPTTIRATASGCPSWYLACACSAGARWPADKAEPPPVTSAGCRVSVW